MGSPRAPRRRPRREMSVSVLGYERFVVVDCIFATL